ncbi:MAG: hypothetical protein JWO02_244, partial [Solirubrobacterales bacterium]|nr:hypothetical protein [Solirubrobacterales bacterium]
MKKSIAAFIVGVVAVGLSACGSNDPGSSSTPASSSGAAASAPSTDGIKVAYASALDPNDVADQFGLK